MKLVILQPGYLPWIGFFDQMMWADTFVIYNDVQYTKNDWRNRNRIKNANGTFYLTVPINANRNSLIKDVKIINNNWVSKHIKSIEYSYKKAEFFNNYFDDIKNILERKHKFLIDLDTDLMLYFKDVFNIHTNIIYSSTLGIQGRKTQRLVDICNYCNAREYLTGDSASNYIDLELFKKNGIEVKFHNYKHPVYKQLYGDFIPYLSIIDFLFNCENNLKQYRRTL